MCSIEYALIDKPVTRVQIAFILIISCSQTRLKQVYSLNH